MPDRIVHYCVLIRNAADEPGANTDQRIYVRQHDTVRSTTAAIEFVSRFLIYPWQAISAAPVTRIGDGDTVDELGRFDQTGGPLPAEPKYPYHAVPVVGHRVEVRQEDRGDTVDLREFDVPLAVASTPQDAIDYISDVLGGAWSVEYARPVIRTQGGQGIGVTFGAKVPGRSSIAETAARVDKILAADPDPFVHDPVANVTTGKSGGYLDRKDPPADYLDPSAHIDAAERRRREDVVERIVAEQYADALKWARVMRTVGGARATEYANNFNLFGTDYRIAAVWPPESTEF